MIFKSKRFYHYPVPTPCLGFTAVKDYFTVIKGGSEVLNVLLNDTYIGTPIVTITVPPINGTAVVNLDNTITYTHDDSDNLTDSFEYELSNGTCTDTAEVGVNVVIEFELFRTEFFIDKSSLVSGVEPEILIVIPFTHVDSLFNISLGDTLPSPDFDSDGFYAIADNSTSTDNDDYRIFEIQNNIVIKIYNHLGEIVL